MKKNAIETSLIYIGLFLFFCITSTFCFLSEGTYESGDSIQHFLISKYSFKHPELFLHHWGKPFFTLISSPFSQFGFTGITIFNTLCATLTGLVVYHISKQLQIQRAWATTLFALFTPIYYVVIISGLTEIFFGLILSGSILLFIKQQHRLGAILISVLPFVRSEGYLLLPLFALVLLYRKNWIPVLWLGFGVITYSIVGYFYYNDVAWLLHQNPYKEAKDIYGSGQPFWFVSKNEFLLGIPLVILFLLGLISYAVRKNRISVEEKFLIIGGFIIYFVAHSVFWWKGIFGSLGLIRVIAAVTPLSAIIALHGFNLLLDLVRNEIAQKITTAIIVVLVIWIPFKQHQFPRPLGNEDEVVKKTSTWLKENDLDHPKTYYSYPYFPLFLNKDPFNPEQLRELWHTNIEGIQQGDIVLWDSHFSPKEGRVSLELFSNNSTIKLLKQFSSDNEKHFEIFIFQKQ